MEATRIELDSHFTGLFFDPRQPLIFIQRRTVNHNGIFFQRLGPFQSPIQFGSHKDQRRRLHRILQIGNQGFALASWEFSIHLTTINRLVEKNDTSCA